MNKSGISPLEYKVLIQPDEVEKQSSGGIVYTSDVVEQDQNAQVNGKLIEAGSLAFEQWDVKPGMGVRVLFAKYAGIYTEGDDGKMYRLINDKDILGMRA
tara:strand:- start:1401 stop:1700 length:300 start_codon:yes stop_codon:yes gene_type:complete